MGTTSEKLTYLNNTKQLLKDKINNLGGSITNETTFRQYVNQLQNVYDNLPKTDYAEGSNITLSNTLKGKLDFDNGVVGIGQSEQKTTQGYNLLDPSKVVTYSAFTINKVGTTRYSYIQNTFGTNNFFNNLGLESAEYTVSFQLISGTYSGGNLVIRNSSNTSLGEITIGSGTTKLTKVVTGAIDKLTFWSCQTTTNCVFDIQIERGSTSHNFEQYTGGYASPSPNWEQPIQCVTGNQDVVVSGINKLQQKLPTTTLNGITCTNNSDGSYTFSGTASANVNFRIDQSTTDGTDNLNTYKAPYTMVASIVTGTPIGSMFLGGYSDSESWSTPLCNIGTVRTITSNINNAFCYIRFETGNVVNETIYPMILDGEYTSSNIPNFEPYITPTSYQLSLGDIELNAIGNYKDELIYDVENDKVYKNEKILKERLTSTGQNWDSNVTAISGKFRYVTQDYKDIIVNPSTVTIIGDVLCNYYKPQVAATAGSYGGNQGIAISNAGSLYINDNNYPNNLASWKNWLDSVECYACLVLKQSTQTELTDTTLKQQVKNWYYSQSFNGTTIITSNGDLPMIIKVRALKGE